MKKNEKMMKEYFETKDVPQRCELLKKIVLNCEEYTKEFFYQAYKKERYLDMRLMAIRGYAHFASEEEVDELMKKMLDLLIKIPTHTPYAYEEYAYLRSEFLMKYLLKKYNYKSFQVFNEQLEKQYNDMPEVFKDLFSLDENGNLYDIKDNEEAWAAIDKFLSE